MNLFSQFIFRLAILLLIIWCDINFIAKFLIFDLRLSFLLLFVIFLQNFKDIQLNHWYLPLFLSGIVNDLILPSSYIGLTSFFLLSVSVTISRMKEQNFLSFPSQVFIGDSVYYILTALSIVAISGVDFTYLLLSSLLLNTVKLILLNFVFQLFIIWFFNFGRDNV